MNEWYYAHGGKQSGPITRDALLALAKNGGLDPVNDLVWTSTMKDWQPAGQVPGIFTTEVSSTPPASAAPYTAPSSSFEGSAAIPPGDAVPEIMPGSQPLKPTACVKRAFDLAMKQFGMILLVGMVYIAASAVADVLLTNMDSALRLPPANHTVYESEHVTNGSSSSVLIGASGKDSKASFPHILLANIFSIFLSLGLIRIGLNIVSGKPFTLGMLFGGVHQLLTAFCASILYLAMVLVGLMVFIFPGIYLALRFGQFMPAIVDKNLGVLESLKYSASITTNNCLNLIGIVGLTFCIIIAGILALLLGLVVAIPVVWLTWMVAFRWLQFGYVAVLDQAGTTKPMLAGNP